MEDIAKRRGFFWQSCEIYGGLSGFYDYGHLGTSVKKNLENAWRKFFLSEENFYELETSVILHENVLIASGHVQNFVDPIVKCKKCNTSHRADHIIEEYLKESFEGLKPNEFDAMIKKHDVRCSKCKGQLEEVDTLNMMFPLQAGTKSQAGTQSQVGIQSQAGGQNAYLRPETAQGAYINFKRIFDQTRKQLPLGLAIIGKAFRNEISPRNTLLRMREFTQAELQIFFNPEKVDQHPGFKEIEEEMMHIHKARDNTDKRIVSIKELDLPEFYKYYMARIQQFYLNVLRIPEDAFRFRELSPEEKAFYNKYHWDIELKLPSVGWKEVGGLHYRTDHDLMGHQKISKQDMSIFHDGNKFVPHVIEVSFGIDRNVYSLFDLGYLEEKERAIFRLPRLIAPFNCAVFPLVNKDGLPEKAKVIMDTLKNAGFSCFYDSGNSVGRRYRRMDEIGVPACITIDNQTTTDNTVTLRDRDSMKQIRVNPEDLERTLKRFLDGEPIEKLGNLVI